MARSRFIRPEFFTDERIGELPYGARLLYIGIWCHCDLRGVFEYSAKQLRASIFPFDEGLSSESVQQWLDQLVTLRRVVRFESGGKVWGHVVKWAAYQSITGSETKFGTKRPEPPPVKPELCQPCAGIDTAYGGHHDVTLSPSPAPSPSPSPAPAYENARASDGPGHWPYERIEWGQQYVAAGCKIGPNNWTHWKRLGTAHGHDLVIQVAKALPATNRWPDATEAALKASQGQSPSLNDAIAHKRQKVVL